MPQDLPSTKLTLRAALINGLLGVSILAVLSIGWAAYSVGNLARSTTVPDLAASVDKLNTALDTINAPCVGDQPCRGTLGSINKAIVKIGDMAVTSQRQVAQTGALVTATAKTMAQAGESITEVSGKLSGAADAATGMLTQAQTDLQTANGTIQAFQPLISHSDAAVQDLDARITALAPIETSLTNVTAHLSQITFDGQQVSDDLTEQYFTPKPLWKKALGYLGDGFDFGALVARHVR